MLLRPSCFRSSAECRVSTVCVRELAASADQAARVASDASEKGAHEMPTAMSYPKASVPQNGINGPSDMYLALKRMTRPGEEVDSDD